MRKTGARAAALLLLALALVAPGCDLVSSLTPFGVGHQDYGGSSSNVNGNWTGATSTGGDFTMQVASDKVLDLKFRHYSGTCYIPFELTAKEVRVVDDTFLYENTFDSQGAIHVEGHFTSSGTCSGSYFFEGRPVSSQCPGLVSGAGTFTATKNP